MQFVDHDVAGGDEEAVGLQTLHDRCALAAGGTRDQRDAIGPTLAGVFGGVQ
jgi:hypothetical protein